MVRRGAARRTIACLYATLVLSIVPSSIQAQPSGGVDLGPSVRVSLSGERIDQIWAHADPRDGQHLIACGYFSYPHLNVKYGYVYSSFDAGTSWRRTLLDDSTRWVTEESCAYGEKGHAYFVDGESDTSTGEPHHRWGHLQLFVSDDHGMTWKRAGRRAEGFVDWPFLVAIPADRKHSTSLVMFGNEATDRIGHWWDQRPVALTATGDARTISGLIAPTTSSIRTFAGGSVVLPDRTALFIAGSTDERLSTEERSQLRIYGFSPSEQKLQVLATLRKQPSGFVFLSPQLVQDAGAGGFHNRLYAAWSELEAHGAAQLWLSTSDDNGYNWSSRIILPKSIPHAETCPNDALLPSSVRIAVNLAGTLGVLWSRNAREVLFTSSNDGGRTFRSSDVVARHEMGKPSVTEAIPHNEWLLAETLASREGKRLAQFVDHSLLGLSVRMSKAAGISDLSLVADAKGVFHALWAGVDAENTYALLTRTIHTPSDTPGVDTALTTGVATRSCEEGMGRLHTVFPSPPPSLDMAGQPDIAQSFNLQIDRIHYTTESHLVTAEVILINRGDSVLQARLSLFGIGLHSDYGDPVALNASGVSQGQPFWDLSSVIATEGLQPKASSKPLELRFELERFQSVITGDAVAMLVRVYRK